MENWDDIRVFLAVARQGGFAPAAQNLGINHTTVARRLSNLEAALHTRLVNRTPTGATLTPAGENFLYHAERMENEALAAEQRVYTADGSVAGKVRLATREGVGAWLICPKVAQLRRRHPELNLELVSEARTISLLKRDADITISLQYPQQDRVIVQKLTDYRLGLFASPEYLREYGPIDSIAELNNRDVIWYLEDFVDIAEQRYMQRIVANSRAGFRATNILAQYAALVAGMGVGIIPVYQAGQDPGLVRVLPDQVEEMRTYWLSVHPDAQGLPNVRTVIDFVLDIVKEKKALF
ncbi:MAG TPA: LysR family transcriptional regulator [Rhizomicrobium sp.]|nr:LysR family transcriptional regulator [Rhizomicrobium sp.]